MHISTSVRTRLGQYNYTVASLRSSPSRRRLGATGISWRHRDASRGSSVDKPRQLVANQLEALPMKRVFAGLDDPRPRRGRGAKLSPAREADRALALRDRVPHLGGHFIQFLRDAGHRRSGARALYGDALVVAFQVEPVYSQTDETEPIRCRPRSLRFCTLGHRSGHRPRTILCRSAPNRAGRSPSDEFV